MNLTSPSNLNNHLVIVDYKSDSTIFFDILKKDNFENDILIVN